MLTRTLWLAMWNHDTFGHNDFLGEIMLPLDTYQESGFSWDDPSPNWYPLRERVSDDTCLIQKLRLELYQSKTIPLPLTSRDIGEG